MSASLAERLARPEILALAPFDISAQANGLFPADAIKLDANENPYPPLSDGPLSANVNRYPEPQPERLRVAMAGLYGVNRDNLVITRGADEIRKDPRDHFMTLLLVRGDAALVQDDREAQMRPGDLIVYDQSKPFALEFGQESSSIVLTIPRPLLIVAPASRNPDPGLVTMFVTTLFKLRPFG